jgi:hypothetical protein
VREGSAPDGQRYRLQRQGPGQAFVSVALGEAQGAAVETIENPEAPV